MQASISTRFDEQTLKRLDEAVSALGKTRSGLIKEAVNHYLEYITWYKAEVQKGFDDLNAGKVKSHEEVGKLLKEAGIELNRAEAGPPQWQQNA